MAVLRINRDGAETTADLRPQVAPTAGVEPAIRYKLRKLGICDQIMQLIGGSG